MTTTIMPSGISTSMFFRLCTRAPKKRIDAPRDPRVRRVRGAETFSSPRRYCAVSDSPFSISVGKRALEDDLAAVFAGAGAEIDDVVGRAHHVGIVLHHHDGIAEFAQLLEDADEASGIAAVQADGRLVEHVAGADQARAERGGELDALRFAAGKRGGQPIEREVFQADVVEKFQALADLDENLLGDGGFFGAEAEREEELLRLGDVHAHDLGEVHAADADVERFLAQARALALRAERVAAVAAQEDAHVDLVLLGFQVIEEAADELVERLALRRA